MTIKTIITMDNEKLSIPSLLVTNFSDGELKELINNMQETMKEKMGLGLLHHKLVVICR